MTDKEVVEQMLKVKEAADKGVSLVSNQGQAMDGFSELANYRSILERREKFDMAAAT